MQLSIYAWRVVSKRLHGLTAVAGVFVLLSTLLVTERATAAGDKIYYPGEWQQLKGRAWLFNRKKTSHNGAIIMDDHVILIDAGMEPNSGKYVEEELRKVTHKPIRYLVLSHYHDDHVMSLPYFRRKGIPIIGHTETARIIARLGSKMIKQRIKIWGKRSPELKIILKDAKIENVTLTFDKKMVFGEGEDRVELLFVGAARTPGDVFVWLPKEKVMFTGDAINKSVQPLQYDYPNIRQWTDSMKKVRSYGAELYVPMHGKPFKVATVNEIISYYSDLRKGIQSYVDRKVPLEQIQNEFDLVKYKGWRNYDRRFKSVAIPVMYKEVTGQTKKFYDIQ